MAYKPTDKIYIISPSNGYINALKSYGPIVSPMLLTVKTVFDILMQGIPVYQYILKDKSVVKLEFDNVEDDSKIGVVAPDIDDVDDTIELMNNLRLQMSTINQNILTKASTQYIDEAILSVTSNSSMIITPETYGAVGDGENDDTVAVQKAFDIACGYYIDDLVGSTSTVSGYLDETGTVMTSSDWVVYDPIVVEGDSLYEISNINESALAFIVLYNSLMEVTRYIVQKACEITTAENEVYIRFSSSTLKPTLVKTSHMGRICFLSRKKYRITERLYTHKPIIVLGASNEDSILLFKGDAPGSEVAYDPINYEESHAVITVMGDSSILQNFSIYSSETRDYTASAWNGIICHRLKPSGDSYYGSTRHSFMQLNVRGFKNGIFLYAGWNRHIINCSFLDCTEGGIQYKPLELSTTGNWSASGDTIVSSQFVGNGIGLIMDRTFETTAQNCIFEYNGNAIKSIRNNNVKFINCWNEANTGKILVTGAAKFDGGYNISANTIEHTIYDDGIVMIDHGATVVGLKGTEIVFYQEGGIITKGVNIGSALINLLDNPAFGTIATAVLSPWTTNNTSVVTVDQTVKLNDLNSVKINSIGDWTYDPDFGLFYPVMTVSEQTDYMISFYIQTDDMTAIDYGVYVTIRGWNSDGTSVLLYIGQEEISPIANGVWEKKTIQFNTSYCPKIDFFITVKRHGRVWVSNPMLALPSVSEDYIVVKKTADANLFNVMDNMGLQVAQLPSKDYVDNKNVVTDSVTSKKYTWGVTVSNGTPTVTLTEIV